MSGAVSRAGRPRAVGALTILSCILCASVVLRISGGIAPALAQHLAAGDASSGPKQEETVCEPPPDIATVLAKLQERSKALDARERQLDAHEQTVSLSSKAVEENLRTLKQAETDLSRKLDLASEAAEKDLSRLTAMYENMDSDNAAALFQKMAPDFAAGFLARMDPAAAAEIMSGLTPDTAYTISALMAGRHADLPTE